jgi:hypothetical protein
MASFAEVLAARKAQLAESALTEDVQVLLGDELVTLRYQELPGTDWARIVAQSGMRKDVLIDRGLGYDPHRAAILAWNQSGKFVDGDEAADISKEEWESLLAVVYGPDFAAMADVVYLVQQRGPYERTAAAKKASTAGSKTKRTSPAS